MTPDGLRFIWEAHHYDPETIRKHLLVLLLKIYPPEVVHDD
jgi:hypothetical protein